MAQHLPAALDRSLRDALNACDAQLAEATTTRSRLEGLLAQAVAEAERITTARAGILQLLGEDAPQAASARQQPTRHATRRNGSATPVASAVKPDGHHELHVGELPKDGAARVLRVLEVAAGAPLTLDRIARYTHLSKHAVKPHLHRFVASGQVRAEGWTNSRRFFLGTPRPSDSAPAGATEGD